MTLTFDPDQGLRSSPRDQEVLPLQEQRPVFLQLRTESKPEKDIRENSLNLTLWSKFFKKVDWCLNFCYITATLSVSNNHYRNNNHHSNNRVITGQETPSLYLSLFLSLSLSILTHVKVSRPVCSVSHVCLDGCCSSHLFFTSVCASVGLFVYVCLCVSV